MKCADLFAGAGGFSTGAQMAGAMRKLRKHGLSRTPEYRAWQQMRLRCTNQKHAAWKDYGGRGITVCPQWLDSPTQFLADMGKKPTPEHELDRRDNARGYEPSNCRWVLRNENCRNRRSNRVIEHNGEALPMAAWADRFGVSPDVISKRLDSGWSVGDALSKPTRKKAPIGQAKHLLKTSCIACGDPTGGTWCKPCANRSNSKKRIAAASVARDILDAIRSQA